MKNYVKRPWSHRERVLLSKNYYMTTKEELQNLFPGRTYNACVKQVKYLKDRGWAFTRIKPES